jgi:glycosyltransferase involved in cell wall biosynthesis
MSDDLSFSVLLPVYRGDNPETLETAIRSVINQSKSPDELVIVRDGPLTSELDNVVNRFHDEQSFITRVTLSQNLGLGGALREGMKHCSGEFVARMDADDISPPDRFKRQSEYLQEHPETDIIGGYIAEFGDDPENILAKRIVPTTHEEIVEMARFRSPFNHATVMMRRELALSSGNYRAVDFMEDWDLWSRMILNGATTANLPLVLLKVRAGEDMYGRRGGVGYTHAEFNRQIEFLRRGFVNFRQFTRNLAMRVPVRILPDRLRGAIYRQYLRDK